MYYIKDNEQIVLADEVKQNIINSLEFMPQYKDLSILETVENEVIVDFKLMTKEEAQTLEDKKEKERIAHLHLTKREVFLGLYNAKQVTPDMIKAQITEPSALIEFEYATEYYRGNPLIDIIGAKLNITPKQLDLFFEYNDYLYLTNCTLTINATPTDAIVKINDKETKTQTVPYSTIVDYEVSATDYITQNNSIELKQDEKIDIVLSKIEDKQETV